MDPLDEIPLLNLAMLVLLKQQHEGRLFLSSRLLFEIAPDMLEGIGDLAPVLRQGYSLLDQVLDMADLHLILLEIFPDILVDIAGMTQHQVFIFRP